MTKEAPVENRAYPEKCVNDQNEARLKARKMPKEKKWPRCEREGRKKRILPTGCLIILISAD
jgi:hypothetical protein